MTTENFRRWLCPSFVSLIIILLNKPCASKNLTLENIAVQFTVYHHDSYNETLQDVKAKAELVSSQFRGVFSFGVMARNDGSAYNFGSTYNQSFPQVYTAEAVGLVNKEAANPLSIFIGIHPHLDNNLFKKEVELARRSALISENLKPETVKGFVLDFKDLPLNRTKIDTAIEMIVSSKPLEDTYFGLRLNCDTIIKDSANISELILRVHYKMNFFVCVEHGNISLQGKQAFEQVARKFESVNATMQKDHSSVRLIGQTGIPARGNVKEDVEKLEEFWEAAEGWLKTNDFHVIMTEAFDNPWRKWDDSKTHEGHYGWWNVSRNNDNAKFNVFKRKDPALIPVIVISTTGKPGKGVGVSGSQVIDTSFTNVFTIIGIIFMRFVV